MVSSKLIIARALHHWIHQSNTKSGSRINKLYSLDIYNLQDLSTNQIFVVRCNQNAVLVEISSPYSRQIWIEYKTKKERIIFSLKSGTT